MAPLHNIQNVGLRFRKLADLWSGPSRGGELLYWIDSTGFALYLIQCFPTCMQPVPCLVIQVNNQVDSCMTMLDGMTASVDEYKDKLNTFNHWTKDAHAQLNDIKQSVAISDDLDLVKEHLQVCQITLVLK